MGSSGINASTWDFGSFCIDGLAMALHACYHTKDFLSAISHGVNLLGDADSIGSIAGQIAGAFYGYSGIQKTAQALITDMNRHCDSDICYRAALLFHVAKEQNFACAENFSVDETREKSSSGFMAVLWVLLAVLVVAVPFGVIWYCKKQAKVPIRARD